MLHRGGLLALAGFILGALLVLWRSLRRGLPLWVPVATVAMLATAATEDEITGTTPAWIIVAATELYVLYLARRSAQPAPGGSTGRHSGAPRSRDTDRRSADQPPAGDEPSAGTVEARSASSA